MNLNREYAEKCEKLADVHLDARRRTRALIAEILAQCVDGKMSTHEAGQRIEGLMRI